MLRMLGASGLHPLALLAIGAVLIGAGLWQHLTIVALVGAYLVVRGAIGAARRREA